MLINRGTILVMIGTLPGITQRQWLINSSLIPLAAIAVLPAYCSIPRQKASQSSPNLSAHIGGELQKTRVEGTVGRWEGAGIVGINIWQQLCARGKSLRARKIIFVQRNRHRFHSLCALPSLAIPGLIASWITPWISRYISYAKDLWLMLNK
jgi:hypothetical protein